MIGGLQGEFLKVWGFGGMTMIAFPCCFHASVLQGETLTHQFIITQFVSQNISFDALGHAMQHFCPLD